MVPIYPSVPGQGDGSKLSFDETSCFCLARKLFQIGFKRKKISKFQDIKLDYTGLDYNWVEMTI